MELLGIYFGLEAPWKNYWGVRVLWMAKACNSIIFHSITFIFVTDLKEVYSLKELANVLPLVFHFQKFLVIFGIQKISVVMLTLYVFCVCVWLCFILRKPVFALWLYNIFLFSSSTFIVYFLFFSFLFYVWLTPPSRIYFSARLWVRIQLYYFHKT